MGKILSYKHGEQSVSGVDPRLWDSVQHAISAIPYDAVIRSGSESRGASDKGNHMEGFAIDVTLYDPQTGEKLPDTAKANAGASFAAYEQLAQATRVYQQQTYPELNSTLRWGGGFHQGGTPGDLMHLDITPSAKGAMAYYNWDTGLNSAGQTAFPNAKSNGGLGDSRTVNLYKQSLAGNPGLIPPANVGNAPVPMNRPAALSVGTAPQDRLGATAGDIGQGALSNTTTLGWDGTHTIAGETIRNTIPVADSARARLTASNVGGVGSVSDPNLSAMTNPALARAFARLGAAVTAGTGASGTANLTAAVAPQPMPNRPPDAQVVKASAPASAPLTQEQIHNRLMAQQSPDPNRNVGPTVMSGVIGGMIKQEAPKITAALGAGVNKATNSLQAMGTNIGKTATNLGSNLGGLTSSIGNTFGNFLKAPVTASTIKTSPVGALNVGGSVVAGGTGVRGSASLTATPRPTGGIAGLSGIGGSAVAGNTSRTGTVTLAQLNAASRPASTPISQPTRSQPVLIAQAPPPASVQIASGKNVAVGTSGTAQGGKFTYSVQSNGSIVNNQTGRVTAPATKR